ncbi:hypothetical protein RI129_010084 [Pyrocoelia pectoralis]|uniref:Uncharacterized protein n=1 Tax=Pyrocoelia pectoralis TaxID=417401 RepID=A0AAN7ZFH0_9COLE
MATTETVNLKVFSTLPTLTVPPENFRFIPGSTVVLNNTSTASSFVNNTISTLKSPSFNGTGYYIDDEVEQGLSEFQTLILACLATFIPLIISLLAGFGIRILWKKYRRYRECNNYDGDILQREESSEPRPLCSHLLNSDQLKCTETRLSIPGGDMEICDGITTVTNGIKSTSHSSTNGSIITMTLKNNHLIVETEERNDIEDNSRETTMKYSPGARNGVFVVEVQQGSRKSPSSTGTSVIVDPNSIVSMSDQCALIHNPPDRYSDEEMLEECDYPDTIPSRETASSLHILVQTGLTQSNSSLSSSSVQTYRYGNQEGYESGYYGYQLCNGCNYNPPLPKVESKNKPKIISEIFKNSRSESKCGSDPYSDGPLLSDVQLKESTNTERSIRIDSIDRNDFKIVNA